MVKYQRFHQWRKGEVHVIDEESLYAEFNSQKHQNPLAFYNYYTSKRGRPKLLSLVFLSLLCFCFILTSPSTLSLLFSFGVEDESLLSKADVPAPLCSSVPNGTICCERNSHRTDVCIMKGDVRTHSISSSVFLYKSNGGGDYVAGVSDEDNEEVLQHEKIRPYTRKWETSVMNSIDELDLTVKRGNPDLHHHCDVQHDVPAVFFSTGGYTGNVYHEFNDGILPLYITSQHFNKKVVFVILEYHNWWVMKYGDILSHLTDYPPIDFSGDKRVHCFPQAIVGLRIHDELTVDPSLMEGNKTIRDFRDILDRAYWPRIQGLIQDEEREAQENKERLALSPSSGDAVDMMKLKRDSKKPKLVILARNGSRAITNEDSLVKMAEEIGFSVEVFRPTPTSELAKIYRVLNSSDVMVGVHGAAMTHFLFMKPGSVFIQVIPLGTDWAAETYYGEPAVKLGLRYIGYKIFPKESSLYDDYDKNDPVLVDPSSVTNKGWEFTKKIYLDRQNVRLNLGRIRKKLLRAYYYTVTKKSKKSKRSRLHQSQ